MADNSFKSALKRLFSTNVIVRKTGKGRLKVTDTSNMQNYAEEYLTDRFSRVYKTSLAHSSRREMIGYSTLREQLYRDYEVMDQDPILASACDIYADESTTRDEHGNILKISTTDDNIKEILENLFFDVLNVEFNLWPWVRNLTKYGDFMLHLHLSEKYGVINAQPLSIHEMDRVENSDPENPHYVKYVNRMSSNETYENYEIAHFRLHSDSNFLPYGKSMLENGRRIFKQLQLMEDAMLIHRIMRAPSKRVFKIDIGNIPPNEVDNYMAQVVNKMKKEPHMDKQTGEYNLRYNMQNMTEDFYLPVRGQNSNSDISELSGLSYDGIQDIEYLKSKLMSALKIPKAYLGYDEGLNGKATLAQEDIRFARTIERIQRIVESELTKIAIVHLYSQGYTDADLTNFSIRLNNPSTIYTREQIEILSSKIALISDIKDLKMLSNDWIYENILELPNDDKELEIQKLYTDMELAYKLSTIETDGIEALQTDDDADEGEGGEDSQESPDVEPTNQGGGATDADSSDEDEADSDAGDVLPPLSDSDSDPTDAYSRPDLHSNKKRVYTKRDYKYFGKQGGRPRTTSRYEKDDHSMGRDPLGRKELTRNESIIDKFGLRILKKKLNTSNNSDLLNEENLLNDDN